MATKTREKLGLRRSKKEYAKEAKSNKLLGLLATVSDHRKGQGKRH